MSSFDLETAISAWRASLRRSRAFLRDDVDELEAHLRDLIDAALEGGHPEKAAFEHAVRRLGDRHDVEAEFRKVRWGRTRRLRTAIKSILWEGTLAKSYFKMAIRGLRRQPGYSFITIGGLALGLATSFVILLFVAYELSFDDFHEQADRIYRVVRTASVGDREEHQLRHSALLAPTIVEEIPGVETAVRIGTRYPEVLAKRDGNAFYETDFYFTDSSFFEVFSTTFLRGDPATALARPYTLAISKSIATKYFGDKIPVGQTLSVEGLWGPHDYEVTAVVEDFPPNSHFNVGFLTSMATLLEEMPNPEDFASWHQIGHHTYVLLRSDAGREDVIRDIATVYTAHQDAGDAQAGSRTEFDLQPLPNIHLYSNLDHELAPTFDVRYLYVFSALALLVLGVACINFMNLATARASRRAREVGVRKVVGAYRIQLIWQFLSEAVVFGTLALILASILLVAFVPLFERLSGREIVLAQLLDGAHIAAMIVIGLAVGAAAGVYPAFFLSRFRPVRVLRGLLGLGAGSKNLRRGLVIAQFAISFGLIAGTLVIGRQLDFMQRKNLGLNEDRVVVINTHGALGGQFSAFREELLGYGGIENATVSAPALPVRGTVIEHYPEGFDGYDVVADGIMVGPAYLETLEIELIEGSELDESHPAGYVPVLINEAATREFGWEEPIGKTFRCCFRPTPIVVGVVADFHYRSVKETISPLVLMPTSWSRDVLVRVGPDDLSGAITHIGDTWEQFAPGAPFDYSFMDARFDATYRSEQELARIFGAFSVLGIVIACMGLFGLAAFMAESRTKEFGIRKVMGATAANIVGLLSREFVALVLAAIVIGVPIVFLASRAWLQDFAYRMPLGADLFIGAALVALVVSGLTVAFQGIKAARASPARSLRYE